MHSLLLRGNSLYIKLIPLKLPILMCGMLNIYFPRDTVTLEQLYIFLISVAYWILSVNFVYLNNIKIRHDD